MPEFLLTALWPIRWVVEAVLASVHDSLVALGMDERAGITWVSSLLALLALARLLVLPLSIASMKNAQKMVLLTDKLIDVRERYRGHRDATARRRKSEEIRALRASTDARQVKSLLPQLIQVPLFLSLYAVLRTAQAAQPGVGAFTARLARSFGDASILGVPFRSSLLHNHGAVAGIVLGVVLTLVIAICQFVAQALALRFNITDQARSSPTWRFRPTPLFVAPPILASTSIAMPVGLLFYLGASSVWTLLQQGFFLLRYPLPTTGAHAARQRRLHKARATRA